MKKIAVVTATRAEYGLLLPVIKQLRKYEGTSFQVEVVVTGTHLKKEYGRTIEEIESDGIRIDEIVEIPVNSATEKEISLNQAETLVKFTKLFVKKQYQAILLLGDRYETLAIAIAAGNTKTPIFHLCGGDTTEGAIDEWIRHSITKISYLHFPTNEKSKKRIIQLGEDPSRVFNYGSTSIDNIISLATMSRNEALQSIGLDKAKYFLCTYHPVTMEKSDIKEQLDQFLETMKEFPEYQFIVTKSNADLGGEKINQMLDIVSTKINNLHVFSSLGVKRYLSLMKYAEAVVGNSSSGIIETPAFKIPTINIGDRQKGRLRCGSIIDCKSDKQSIVEAIRKSQTGEFRDECMKVKCPYGEGHAAELIAKKVFEVIQNDKIDLRKKFYDIGEQKEE